MSGENKLQETNTNFFLVEKAIRCIEEIDRPSHTHDALSELYALRRKYMARKARLLKLRELARGNSADNAD